MPSTLTRRPIPKGWGAIVAGRLVRTESPMPDPIPPPDPEKKPAAAEPMKCSECSAMLEPGDKYCGQCGAEVPGAMKPEDGSPALPVSEARALSRHVLALTGSRTPDAARGTLAAWQRSAGELVAARQSGAESLARLETIERTNVLESAVRAGTIDPALAWSWGVDAQGNKTRSFSAWAGPVNAATGEGQSLAQLNAYLSASAARPSNGERSRITPAAETGALSSFEQARAKQLGMTPEEFAAYKSGNKEAVNG